LALAVVTIAVIFHQKDGGGGDKLTPFECGFEPIRRAREGFSLRFFLLAVLFLIFDVEIALLIPLPLVWGSIGDVDKAVALLIFLAILIIGLLYEWHKGALD